MRRSPDSGHSIIPPSSLELDTPFGNDAVASQKAKDALIARAVIFDMDGVLIDSEPLWRRAEIATFSEVGLDLTDRDCLNTTGLRIDEAVDYWFSRAPWTGRSRASVADAIVERVAGLIRDAGRPLAGVDRAIDEATHRGYRLGVASSSPEFLIETVLDRFGLKDTFAATCSAEREPLGKPHPGVYLTAARALDVDPRRCVAIEDSVNGVVSALAAQMSCIAVPAPGSTDDPRFAIATRRLASLEGLGEALDALEVGD